MIFVYCIRNIYMLLLILLINRVIIRTPLWVIVLLPLFKNMNCPGNGSGTTFAFLTSPLRIEETVRRRAAPKRTELLYKDRQEGSVRGLSFVCFVSRPEVVLFYSLFMNYRMNNV